MIDPKKADQPISASPVARAGERRKMKREEREGGFNEWSFDIFVSIGQIGFQPFPR
ncbi:MAG: hypothetical protein NPINA01_32210 [Nitrospinaceae bacterium]|jgi:hypothetical protein|nr:MAG: hypothetical protein NPINA01_32210 [Nitrospinaceae bacterium]